jgi:RIO kinase 1
MDIKNITDYFSKKSVSTLSERKAFEFITSDSPISRQEIESRIEELMDQNDAELEKQNDERNGFGEDGEGTGGGQEREGEREVEERVFRQAYIPRNLFEVVDPERDVGIIERGGKDDLIYARFLSVQETKSQNTQVNAEEENVAEVTEEADSESDDEDDTESEEDGEERPRGKRYEDKEAKKERKQKVKEEARERRKNKIPKAEKKRKIKVSKGKK